MNPRGSLVRLKLFQVKEKRRQLGQLDLMMGEFEQMAVELDAQIMAEERKAGITDMEHFAYPTFAKAARQRRDNLMTSIRDLAEKKQAAEQELSLAEADLEKAQAIEGRDMKLRDVADEPLYAAGSAMLG